MFKIYYRGYILIRLKVIGTEWEVVKRLSNLRSNNPDEDWVVTYTTPVYGGWDLVAECNFTKLQELDKIVAYIRVDDDLSSWIEETTTLVSSRPDYPR